MKYFTTVLFFLSFSLSQAQAAESNNILENVRSRIPYGSYTGADLYGNKCILQVRRGIVPTGKHMRSNYFLSLSSPTGYGEFYFISPFVHGGRGDCTQVDVDSDILLELQNSGHHAPCFSDYRRSSSKGLGVYTAPATDVTTVVTYEYRYEKKMECSFQGI